MTTPSLKLLQIDLTDECPLFCAHCSNSSGPGRTTHFPIARLIPLIQEARDLGVQRIVFSGGEPLRYPHLEEAVTAANRASIAITMFTTGIVDSRSRLPVSRDYWASLVEAGLNRAAFSVYAAPSQRTHHNDVVRTRPVVGDAFGANEQAVKDARSTGLVVEAHFIPSGVSVGDLQEIYAWAVELRCSVFHLQIPTYQGRNKDRPVLELSSSDERRLKEGALALKPAENKTQFYISRFWLSRWEALPRSGCVANVEQLIIRTDGTISPCNACKYGSVTLGSENVLVEGATLAYVWRNSRTLQELRDEGKRPYLPPRCEGALATISGLAAIHS